MRATRVYTFLVGIGAMSLGGCVNIHLSDRFGIPERDLLELQTRRAAAGTVLALSGEDAERIMKRYNEIMCQDSSSEGGGSAAARRDDRPETRPAADSSCGRHKGGSVVRGQKNERGATAVLIAIVLLFLGTLGFGAATVGNLVTNVQQARNAANGFAIAAAWQCLTNPIQDLPGLEAGTIALSDSLAKPNFPNGANALTTSIDYWTVADETTNPTWAFADVNFEANVDWVLLQGLGLTSDPIKRAVRAAVRQEKIVRTDMALLAPLYVLVVDYSAGGRMEIPPPCSPCPSMNRVVRDAITGTQNLIAGNALLENQALRSRVEIGGVVHSNRVFDYNIGGPVRGSIPINFNDAVFPGDPVITAFDRPLTYRGHPQQEEIVCGAPPGCKGDMSVGLREARALLLERKNRGDLPFPELVMSYLLIYADGIPKLPGGDGPAQAAARAEMSSLLADPTVVDGAIVIWFDRKGKGTADPEAFMRSLAAQDPQGYVDFPASGVGKSVFVAASNAATLGDAFDSGSLDVKCFSSVLGGGVAGAEPLAVDPIFAYVRDTGNAETKMGRADAVSDLDAKLVAGRLEPPYSFFYHDTAKRLIFSSDVCNEVWDNGASIIVRYGRPRIICHTNPVAGPDDC